MEPTVRLWASQCDMHGVRLLLILFAPAGCGPDDVPGPPLNVLFMTVDTLRADRVASSAPFLMELVSRGVQFENACSTISWDGSHVMDDATRQQLEALGYLESGP